MKGGDEHGHLRNEVQALIARGIEVVAGLGIVIIAAQRTDGGAQGVHWLGVRRQPLDQVNHARWDFAAAGQILLQGGEFVSVGQPLVV